MQYFRFSQRFCFWYVTAVSYKAFTDVLKDLLSSKRLLAALAKHSRRLFFAFSEPLLRLSFKIQLQVLSPGRSPLDIQDRDTHVPNSRINTQKILFHGSFDLSAVHRVTASIVWQYRLNKHSA
jgi:hypothetical protein